MEIIDSRTPGFDRARRAGKAKHVTFGNKLFHINAAAHKDFEFEPGQYLHFVVDTNLLYFFIDDDDHGMKLFRTTNNWGLHGYLKTYRTMLSSRLPDTKLYGSHPIAKSVTKLNGKILYTIQFNKKVPTNDQLDRNKRKNRSR